jgi:hypothetical protein
VALAAHWLVEDRPQPAADDSCLRNASLPSRKLARSSAVTDGSGSPILPGGQVGVKVAGIGTRGGEVPQPPSATQRSGAAHALLRRIGGRAIAASLGRPPVRLQRPAGALRDAATPTSRGTVRGRVWPAPGPEPRVRRPSSSDLEAPHAVGGGRGSSRLRRWLDARVAITLLIIATICGVFWLGSRYPSLQSKAGRIPTRRCPPRSASRATSPSPAPTRRASGCCGSRPNGR